MKNLFLYTIVLVGALFISSCQKERFDAPAHPDATKLAFTDATITTTTLASGDVMSGLPVENDTLALDYYAYSISSLYGLDVNNDTINVAGVIANKSFSEISANKKKTVNYIFLKSTGEILLVKNKEIIKNGKNKGNQILPLGEYFADVNVIYSNGAKLFEKAWTFKVE